MSSIILTDIISDIELLYPGCELIDVFHNATTNVIEFNKMGMDDLLFKPLPSFDNKYEINENGTIIRNAQTKRPLKIFLDKHHSKIGYYATFICYNNIVRRVMIHIAVAEAWIGERPEGFEVDHIDRNPHNNHYTNLRYVTHSEQMKNRILSPRIIEQAKRNCKKYVIECVMKPVKVIDPNGNVYEFPSYTECAKFLSQVLNMNIDHIRKRVLARGLVEYYGYKIIYINEAVKVA